MPNISRSLTRDQLSEFLDDQRTLVAFEGVLDQVGRLVAIVDGGGVTGPAGPTGPTGPAGEKEVVYEFRRMSFVDPPYGYSQLIAVDSEKWEVRRWNPGTLETMHARGDSDPVGAWATRTTLSYS